MKKIIVGKILKNNKVVGSGFLVAKDIVLTAKHNIITGEEIVEGDNKERDIIFRINNDDIQGTTINLHESLTKRIDCVYIRLDEIVCDEEIQNIIECENDITGYNCSTMGFPKLCKDEIQLYGKIVLNDEQITISINKEDNLQTYEGLSGAPLIVAGNIVGIIVQQESIERLIAIPIKSVKEKLCSQDIKFIKRAVPECFLDKIFTINNLKKKVEQIVSIAGPRYSKSLNLKTGIYNELSFVLQKDCIKDRFKNITNKIKDCIEKLTIFEDCTRDDEEIILAENKKIISEIFICLQNDAEFCNSGIYNEVSLKEIESHINENEDRLKQIFKIEKCRFEKKYGAGTFDNQNWRGVMASYMCTFPTRYLDVLQDSIKLLSEISNMIDISLLSKVGKNAILVFGKGGIGKTHLLCDIVNDYLQKELPAVLLLGDFFGTKNSADTVIMDWYSKGEDLESFLSWLNEIGEQNNVFIPICIDAINEVNDNNYWNINLPVLLTKAEKYNNIKIIFSCRTLYLEEYLETNKFNNLLQLEHNGFGEYEVEAVSDFCEYYGVNISYDSTCIPEFVTPLFLKMLCEIAKEKDDKTVVVDDVQKLMNDFFSIKNKIISRNYSEYLSIRDNIVSVVLTEITNYMTNKGDYCISRFDLRNCVSKILMMFGIAEKTSCFIKLLLSENLLRESDDQGEQISFAYQKFYEYLYAQKCITKNIDDIVKAVENKKITLGTLEMIQIEYFNRNKNEFLSLLNNKIHTEAVNSFLSGLYWRTTDQINHKTILVVERLLASKDESDIRRVLVGLISQATKISSKLNAFFIHNKLKKMNNLMRDYIFSYFFLKQYDDTKVLSDLCERAILLKKNSFSEESVLLWKIMLCWGTSFNDIKLRDKSSKGLANLFRLYPNDMLKVVELFNNVNDDYIQERLWQAIYSAIILLQDRKHAVSVMKYIKDEFILKKNWPLNVLIRDSLRNIFEYSFYKKWISKTELNEVRPPYSSQKHQVNKNFTSKWKDQFDKLYWNCQESDFAVYSIPSDVEDYGLSKEDVGLMIFEDIIHIGYNQILASHDAYIDYTYGCLRNRDEQVERIGKKYQKIFLCREMGNIYDNYKYSSKFQNTKEIEIIPPEQGNSFRHIDLTILNQENLFSGTKVEYLFYRYDKWDDIKWFNCKDVERYIPPMISTSYNEENYLILQGNFSSKEIGKNLFRKIWMQIRSYLFLKDKKEMLLEWFDGKNFEGRWMPEGFEQLYECCVGEYPWSPSAVNYLGQEEEQDFGHRNPAPCHLITTVNNYIAEKDSPFCNDEVKSYMFPSKYLFENMNLVWNGTFGYDVKGKTVIFIGRNNSIFIEKNFLIDFLNENNLEIIWTILGEKQKITGGVGQKFPGRSEFSYTYYLDKDAVLTKNHNFYNVANPR